MLMPNVRHNCPRLERVRLLEGSDLYYHLSIPLQVKDKVLGMMSIASTLERGDFPVEDALLLRAIGQQIGVAIENAQLWDVLKQKEAQRGQLLEKLITAQEDEQKRIARELHDEAGSSLTSLMVSLLLLEETVGSAEKVRTKVTELKGISWKGCINCPLNYAPVFWTNWGW
jgi:signal transduction histidine kinase